jgi:small subunit ribosomal protein S15
MLSKQQKNAIIAKFATHDKDTGSPQVQIAMLSAEIKELTSHLQTHKKDFTSRRGLLKKIGQRRRLLRYLKRTELSEYQGLIEQLGLKDNIDMTNTSTSSAAN